MAFSIAMLFGIGDIMFVLSSPTKFPIIQIFLTATGSKGATTAVVCALLSTLIFSTFGLLACASRLTWAFARDNGLPFSDYFAKVRSLLIDPVMAHLHGQTILLTCSPGQQTLSDSHPCDSPGYPHHLSPWTSEHRLRCCLPRLDIRRPGWPLFIVPLTDHSAGGPSLRQKRGSLGSLDVGPLGFADQSLRHGLLDPIDRIHGASTVPAGERRQYELREPNSWGGDAGEHRAVVCLRKEDLLGSGSRGDRGSPYQTVKRCVSIHRSTFTLWGFIP